MSRRVVITGLGAISSLGNSVGAFWSTLKAGVSGIDLIEEDFSGCSIRVGAVVKDFNPRDCFPAGELPLLDRFSQFAVVSAREAMADACLAHDESILEEMAVVIGTGCGGKQTDEETYQRLYRNGASRAHPLTIPKGMPSAAASQVSMHLGVSGPVFSVTSACASAAHAVAQGKLLVESGLADVALVGGTDAPFTYGLLKSWEALRIVSTDTCRPFSNNRSGMVLGEGAAMIVLESEEHARRRGARIYADLAGIGMSSDSGHITKPEVAGMSRAMAKALENAGLDADEVDYINAHGTATHANDIAETKALHEVFGEHARSLAVSSTKSMHGHALGASSALELVATVLAVYEGCIPPTANFSVAGDGCDLDYVPNEARKQSLRAAMSNAFAFGGLNAVLVIGAREHE